MTDRISPENTATTLSTRATGALRGIDIDDARDALRQAQTALAALGYEVGEHGDPAQAIDGIWGQRTREAVLNFQNDRGLPRSGQLDDATTAALMDTQSDAMDIESTEMDDAGETCEAAEQLLHSEDRESLNDVLEGIEPTDSEEDMLQALQPSQSPL